MSNLETLNKIREAHRVERQEAAKREDRAFDAMADILYAIPSMIDDDGVSKAEALEILTSMIETQMATILRHVRS